MGKSKGLSEIFRIVKDYSSAFLAAGIALAALGLIFGVTPFLFGNKLKQNISSTSIKMGNEIKKYTGKVPPDSQWREEQKYQTAFDNDANGMASIIVQSSRRSLLSYKLFPEPKDASIFLFEEFGRAFREGLEKMITDLNAGDCPTFEEIDKGMVGFVPSRRRGGARAQSTMRRGFLGELGKEVEDAICMEKAQNLSIYIKAEDLGGYEHWSEYKAGLNVTDAVVQCWYWQVGYWIIEDVMATAGAMNAGSKSVFTSPVKRIMSVSFSRTDTSLQTSVSRMARSRISKQKKAVQQPKPNYVASMYEGITESCTNRTCSDDIDVVQFNVIVVVNAKDVFRFMQELCSKKEHIFRGFDGQQEPKLFKHNQITILEERASKVYRESGNHDLFRYGDDATVELNLICEYVFNRKGYEAIMPSSVAEEVKQRRDDASMVGGKSSGKTGTEKKKTE